MKIKQTPFQLITFFCRPFQLRIDRDVGDRGLNSLMLYYMCREPHHYIIDYAKKFLTAYNASVPKFSLLWLSYLAHDHHSGAYHSDEYFNQFFQNYYEKLMVIRFI